MNKSIQLLKSLSTIQALGKAAVDRPANAADKAVAQLQQIAGLTQTVAALVHRVDTQLASLQEEERLARAETALQSQQMFSAVLEANKGAKEETVLHSQRMVGTMYMVMSQLACSR